MIGTSAREKFTGKIREKRRVKHNSVALPRRRQTPGIDGISDPSSDLPERHLLAAMLRRAILDLAAGSYHDREDALDWINQQGGSAENTFGENNLKPFSFSWVCLHLNLDEHSIRERVTAPDFIHLARTQLDVAA